MSSTTEATLCATNLHAAAQRLHTSVADADARHLDLRDAVDHVARALGELAATSETIARDHAIPGGPTMPPVSSELVRRARELTASLCAARRNAELVCRHLPAAYDSTSPRRIA